MHLLRYLLILGALVSTLGAYPREVSAQTRLWGTYFGGVSIDNASKVATDTAGNIYVIGSTESPIGVATPNGFQPQFEDYQLYAPFASAAFLAKFDSTGKLIWATYYNDGPWTEGQDLGLDGRGNVYVLGTAHCPSDKLGTPGAYDAGCDVFDHTNMYLAKFDTEGKRLWGTYFGGSGLDSGSALSVTPTGSIYLIGTASSSQGIVPVPSSDSSFGGIRDAVIAKFSSQGQLQ